MPILNQFSAKLESKIYLLNGVNGSGKSTLLDLCSGLQKQNSGIIKVNGTMINKMKGLEISRIVSYQDQSNFIFKDSIKENVLMGRHGLEKNYDTFEKIFKLDDLEKKVVDFNCTGLSGGEKQRICLARTFISDSPIILLDEPTSALDFNMKKVLKEYLSNLKGKTIIFTTHDNNFKSIADNVVNVEQSI